MVNRATIDSCRNILEGLARTGRRITYGHLMRELGIGRHELRHCLNPIYRREIDARRPDLTLIPHYAGKWVGLYNSEGAVAQAIVVDPNNAEQVHVYKTKLSEVFEHWGGQPQGKLKEWLES